MATTIITTQKVECLDKWKLGFEAGANIRTQAGIVIKGIYQSAQEENSVTVISEVSSVDVAIALFNTPEMKIAMEKSGVISIPEVKILNNLN